MLAELVEKLLQTGRDSQAVKFHMHPEMPGKAWLQQPGHALELVDLPAPPRAHQLLGYTDLLNAIADTHIAKAPEVYCSGRKVIALLDRDDRRQKIVVDLAYSSRLEQCRALEGSPLAASPKDIQRVLRFDFHSGKHDLVIDALSEIDFTRTTTTSSRTTHGSDGYGASVNAAVPQASRVPKEFEVVVPIWANEGFSRYSASVRCGLELDPDNQRVILRVLSDEVMRVVNQALVSLVTDLREATKGIPIFMGAP